MLLSNLTRAVLLIAALAGRSLAPEEAAATSDGPNLEGTDWLVAELRGVSLPPASSPTLRFEGGRLAGFDGCNRFAAPYLAKGSSLTVAAAMGATTMVACPPERVALAEAFTTALDATRRIRLEKGRLDLLDDEGKTLATLAPQPADLSSTAWHATAVDNGRQAVVSLVKDSTVTLEFSADGKVAGSAGCNRYSAAYTFDGSRLSFGPAAATRRACARPELMDQEQSFLKALETVATARLDGDRLELRTATGALAVTAKRAPRR